MKAADDAIMEFLEDEGAGTPSLLASELDYTKNYLIGRCSELIEYGLLEKPARGLYRITDEGEAYLAGELDASDLEPDEE